MLKKLLGLIGDRRVVGALLILLQACGMIWLVFFLGGRWGWLYRLFNILSIIMVIWLIRKYDNPAYKMAWIIMIILFPLVGGLFYLFWGNTPFNSARMRHRFHPRTPDFEGAAERPASEALAAALPRHQRGARYIENESAMPVWGDTVTTYYPVGEKQFAAMCEALESAQRFIFLEYFIVEEGVMWNTMLDILARKAQAGVEVRMLYDDAGCIATLPRGYDKYLCALGIRCVRFNRFIPTLNTYLNNRDHRKICVVDGNVGFMGGINLADEYINQKVRFGHWKDTGVRLIGPGVANMTEMFLQMWEYTTGEKACARAPYMPTVVRSGDGYVQPFYDSPLDDRNVGETVFMHIINRAQRYVYITTPYLILDNEMITALTIAAQSGVDVRIVTPGIPDKKPVYMVTRSYYLQLRRAGVKIYEYSPGFLHAKMIVSDDDVAVVGTMNMDFRSFFLHFECGTVLYGGQTITDVRDDILETIGLSREIDADWFRGVPWISSIAASILRLFAPML
ncbi:cardiolipin synthase [Butyricicoccus pullicaecorum]|nr:cardiolipin synthase [Butyricicoccus pullicaecorum]